MRSTSQAPARLIPAEVPPTPTAAVLVLHGGAARPGRTRVSPAQLSVIRMVPVARRIVAAGRGRLAVYRLLNSARGWAGPSTPVDDVHWALAQLEASHGPVPVGLVGHSLGGRAALLAGGSAPVRSVVALNPWLYPHDDADLSGRRVLIVHGTEDRVALPSRARAVAENLSRRTDVEYREIRGGKHAMLQHGAVFESAASDFIVDTLL